MFFSFFCVLFSLRRFYKDENKWWPKIAVSCRKIPCQDISLCLDAKEIYYPVLSSWNLILLINLKVCFWLLLSIGLNWQSTFSKQLIVKDPKPICIIHSIDYFKWNSVFSTVWQDLYRLSYYCNTPCNVCTFHWLSNSDQSLYSKEI